MEKQSRWKSKVLWTALIAQIISLAGMFGLYDLIGITPDWAQGVLSGILEIFVIVGIVNNPVDAQNW